MKNSKDIWKMLKTGIKNSKAFPRKIFRFCLKSIIVVLFLLYVLFGVSSLGVVVEKEIIRHKDIAEFEKVVDVNVRLGTTEKTEPWLKYRGPEDTDRIVEIISKKSSYMTPHVFFRLSGLKFAQGKVEDGLFWFNLGKYRTRYDMLRCGGTKSIDDIEKVISIIFDLRIDDIYKEQKDILGKVLKRVVEFDKINPPKNNPEFICIIVKNLEEKDISMAPEESWPDIRLKMIESAKDFTNVPARPDEKSKENTGKSFNNSAKDH